jgi:hypothetical protein
MIIPLDKLISYDKNRYILTRASMGAVDRIEGLTDYLIEGEQWKIVPNILRLMLDGTVQFELLPEKEEDKKD